MSHRSATLVAGACAVLAIVLTLSGQTAQTPPASGPAESGLLAEVRRLRSEVNDLKGNAPVDRVPLGAMIPYFGKTPPPGYVWADGASKWREEEWLAAGLGGKAVPDLRGGTLVGGRRESTPLGEIWKGGTVNTPTLDVSGAAFTVPPLTKAAWPLGPGWVFRGDIDKDPKQGAGFADPELRDLFLVKFVNAGASADWKKSIREVGLGPSTMHWNGFAKRAEPDNHTTTVAVSLDSFGRPGVGLNGVAKVEPKAIRLESADANPPYLACNWIIRVR